MSASHLGELVNTAGVRARARVIQDSWWIPRVIGPELESHGRSGQHHGPPDKSTRRPGELVDPTGPWTWAQGTQDRWSARQPLDTGPSHPGQLVDTPGPQSRTRITGKAGRTCGPSDPRPSRPGEMVDSAGPQIQARVAGTAGGLRGDSEQGLSRPGELFDTAGGRTRARVFRESWSSPRELGAEPRSPGAFGRSRTTWDTFLSHPRQLVDSACFGPGPETPGTAGRHRGPSEPGASRRGGLVNFSGHWTRA